MTDERPDTVPGTGTDEPDTTRERRGPDTVDDEASREGEGNPLLREGADAPDAADIADPDEQL